MWMSLLLEECSEFEHLSLESHSNTCSSRHPIMSLPGCTHLTVFDRSCVGICCRCICNIEVQRWWSRDMRCINPYYTNCFTYCANHLWCACIRSLVLTKAALYRFISGMCEGSISHIFHNPVLNIWSISNLRKFWVTDEFCPYGLLVVMYTIWPLPGCSAITWYNVSMSLSIHCFKFAIISPFWLEVSKSYQSFSWREFLHI